MKPSAFVVSLLSVLFPFAVSAADYDVSVGASDVFLSPDPPFVGETIRVYTTVYNVGAKDVEGQAIFWDGSKRLGSKLFSTRVNGRPDEVWIAWKAESEGYHDLKIEVIPDQDDASPGNNVAVYGVLVDKDTDGDRVGDRQDLDDDNDGILDTQEIQKGTNPLKADTDGDGVKDKEDAYPLDASRSALPPPPPPTIPPEKAIVIQPTPTPPATTKPKAPATTTQKTVTPATQTSPTADATVLPPVTLDASSVTSTTSTEATFLESFTVTSSLGQSSTTQTEPEPMPTKKSPFPFWLASIAVLLAALSGVFFWMDRRHGEK